MLRQNYHVACRAHYLPEDVLTTFTVSYVLAVSISINLIGIMGKNSSREWGTVDKDSIKKLIVILTLSAPPAGEEGGATGALAIAARVPPVALTIFKMKEAILSCSASN